MWWLFLGSLSLAAFWEVIVLTHYVNADLFCAGAIPSVAWTFAVWAFAIVLALYVLAQCCNGGTLLQPAGRRRATGMTGVRCCSAISTLVVATLLLVTMIMLAEQVSTVCDTAPADDRTLWFWPLFFLGATFIVISIVYCLGACYVEPHSSGETTFVACCGAPRGPACFGRALDGSAPVCGRVLIILVGLLGFVAAIIVGIVYAQGVASAILVAPGTNILVYLHLLALLGTSLVVCWQVRDGKEHRKDRIALTVFVVVLVGALLSMIALSANGSVFSTNPWINATPLLVALLVATFTFLACFWISPYDADDDDSSPPPARRGGLAADVDEP